MAPFPVMQGRGGLFARVGRRFSRTSPTGAVAVADGRTMVVRYVVVGATMEPASVTVPPGEPVRIVFHAGSDCGTGETVVFPGLGRMVTLRRDAETVVEFDSLEPGRYAFACGEGTRTGTLVVR